MFNHITHYLGQQATEYDEAFANVFKVDRSHVSTVGDLESAIYRFKIAMTIAQLIQQVRAMVAFNPEDANPEQLEEYIQKLEERRTRTVETLVGLHLRHSPDGSLGGGTRWDEAQLLLSHAGARFYDESGKAIKRYRTAIKVGNLAKGD